MIANSVVLPAPLGPISPVMRPAGAASEAASSASRPPKRLETRSTVRRGSAMGLPFGHHSRADATDDPGAGVGQGAHDTAWGEAHDEDQHGAVDEDRKSTRLNSSHV